MKIYVASLDRDKKRRESISAQLEAGCYEYEIVSAFDGAIMTDSEVKEKTGDMTYFYKKYGRNIKKTEVACALTHLEMYKRFLSTSAAGAVFIEDDAFFLCDVSPVLSAILQTNLDMVILGYPARGLLDAKFSAFLEPIYGKKMLSKNYSIGMSPQKKNFGTLSYYLSRRGAENLLALYPVSSVIDDHQLIKELVDVHHLRPYIFIEKPGLLSSINPGGRVNGKSYGSLKLVLKFIRGATRNLSLIVRGRIF